jgi:hypothetical protein
MPLIISTPGPGPLVVLSGLSLIEADAGGTSNLRAILRGQTNIVAPGGLITSAAALLAGESDIIALGRIDDEPNVFGAALLTGETDISAAGNIAAGGVTVLNGETIIVADGRVARAESAALNILLTIGAAGSPGFGATYSARIIADGVTYPIKAYNYSEAKGDAGVSLNVTLLRPSDRPAIEAAGLFTFDIYDNDDWTTIFSGGRKSGLGFSFAFNNARPNDGLTVSTAGPIAEQLERSPERNLTVYDSGRVHLHAADFEKLYDTDGAEYVQQLRAVSGLMLYDLLQIVFVEKCGFAGYQTTIPNFPIRRTDFSMTGSFLEGISGHIGMFNPLLFVKAGIVWLLDSTAGFPAGFGDAPAMTSGDYLNAQFSETELNADALIVQFADNETDYDYTTTRTITDDPDETGHFGDANYTETIRSRQIREFWKTSNPLIPVRTDKISQTTETRATVNGGLTLISREVEQFVYDSFGRYSTIDKQTGGLIPDLTAEDFDNFFDTVRSEKTFFAYKPDKTNPRRQILGQTVKETRGVITVDSTNLSLGKPFKQDFTEGFAAGNLAAGITTEFGPIQTITETNLQNQKGQTETKTKTVNFLTDPPQVINATTDARAGDISTNAMTSGTNEIIVFRPGATRTNAKMQTFAVAELPVAFAIPLAQRKLSRRRERRGSVTMKGLRLSIGRGSMFELFDRDGSSAGVYVCEGRSISGDNVGTGGQTTRMILEVLQI